MNLSPEEHFRLRGHIANQHAEMLLDSLGKVEKLDGLENYLQEAKGGFPDEDFLAGVIDDVRCLLKNVRGDNKKNLEDILKKLNELSEIQVQSTEYSLEQIVEVQKALNSL